MAGVDTRFGYVYDFGNNWEHEIAVEKILPVQEGWQYPICPGEERTCPPEDCGGADGFKDFLEAIRGQHHDEHREALRWTGEDFDPAGFDLMKVSERLATVGSRCKSETLL